VQAYRLTQFFVVPQSLLFQVSVYWSARVSPKLAKARDSVEHLLGQLVSHNVVAIV
jgi:hypothetical protein